jgi:hypothetical protein
MRTYELDRLVDHRADIDGHPGRPAAAAERQDALDQQPRAFTGPQHLFDVAVRRCVVRDAGERTIAEAENRGKDIVEVVRDTAGKGAERFELLRLPQLALEAMSRLFVGPALRDVLDRRDDQVFRVRVGRLMSGKHARHAHVGPHDAAVPVHVTLLKPDAILTAHQLVDMILRECPIVGMRDVRCAPLSQLAVAVADHLLKGGVGHQVAVVRAQHQDPDGGVLEYGAPVLLACAHCPARVFQPAHVRGQHIHQQNHAHDDGADAKRRVVNEPGEYEQEREAAGQHHGPVAPGSPKRTVMGRRV